MNNKIWKGYNLEELHIKQATTSLRIDLEKERLKAIAAQGISIGGNTVDFQSVMSTATNVLQTTLYGIRSFKMIKNFIDVCRSLKK